MFSVNLIVTHHHRVLKIQTFARLVHLPSRKIRSYQYQEATFVRLNNKTIPTSQRLQRPSTFFLCLFCSNLYPTESVLLRQPILMGSKVDWLSTVFNSIQTHYSQQFNWEHGSTRLIVWKPSCICARLETRYRLVPQTYGIEICQKLYVTAILFQPSNSRAVEFCTTQL